MNRKYLSNIISKAKNDIVSAPEGVLRVAKFRDSVQFFIRNEKNEKNGKYLSKKDIELAKKLAQKEYAQKILKEAENQLKVLDKYLDGYKPDFAKKVWKNFNPLKKNLIKPYVVPDEEYVASWKAVKYKPSDKPFDKNHENYTKSGIHVRSSMEEIIGDILEVNNIPFRYEYPYIFKVQDWRGRYKEEEFRPDFTVLNARTRKEYIWEHFGMMDRERYRRDFYSKMKVFNDNGFFLGENMIVTFAEETVDFDLGIVHQMMERYLK